MLMAGQQPGFLGCDPHPDRQKEIRSVWPVGSAIVILFQRVIDRLHEKQGIPKNFLHWEQKLSLYLTTFEAVKNALWLDNRGRKMLKTQATAIPKYGNIVTSGV